MIENTEGRMVPDPMRPMLARVRDEDRVGYLIGCWESDTEREVLDKAAYFYEVNMVEFVGWRPVQKTFK